MGQSQYAFGYNVIDQGDEVFFEFAKLPHVMAVYAKSDIDELDSSGREALLQDAVITGLQSLISSRYDIPQGDSPAHLSADGFVFLDCIQAMKLELYRVYLENCTSALDLARKLGKQETAARRLLNLRHRSRPSEVDAAISCFGKRLRHSWSLEQAADRELALT